MLDLKNNLQLANDGNSIKPQTATATANGSGIDLNETDGLAFGMINVGTVSGTAPTCDVKVQESSDNSSFTDISGATFTQVTASNKTQLITFKRTKRYVRLVATIAGTSPSFAIAGQVFAFKKNVL
jgi:hypothetical protein